MLLVAARGREEEVRRVFAQVGARRGRDRPRHRAAELDGAPRSGEVVARVPVDLLADAPRLREAARASPRDLAERRAFDPLTLPGAADHAAAPDRPARVADDRVKEWAFRQYDQQVGINTLILPGSDAAVLRVKSTRARDRRVDGRQRPPVSSSIRGRGAAMAVCEAARNVSCSGASRAA